MNRVHLSTKLSSNPARLPTTCECRYRANFQHTVKDEAMIEKYRREKINIRDAEFEEYDLELDTLDPSDKTSDECEDATENY